MSDSKVNIFWQHYHQPVVWGFSKFSLDICANFLQQIAAHLSLADSFMYASVTHIDHAILVSLSKVQQEWTNAVERAIQEQEQTAVSDV
jgi:hypothetical protein